MADFKFEKLEVWKDSIALSSELFSLAEKPGLKANFRFLNQLYGATMSISNNIAEGAGSVSKKEFARYLGIARASVFEVVNILYIFERQGILSEMERKRFYDRLLLISKGLYFLRKSLISD